MINRRQLLVGAGALGVATWLPAAGAMSLPAATVTALEESDLVYVTALKAGGSEGKCHAEVWFAHADGVPWVVTDAKSWRVRAIRAGNDQVRVWVGDHGQWKDAGDTYRQSPTFTARGAIVSDAATHARILEVFGSKYRLEWLVWGPRFRDGLAEGSRKLLRYTPLAV